MKTIVQIAAIVVLISMLSNSTVLPAVDEELSSRLAVMLPPNETTFPGIVEAYLAYPDQARFLLTLANLEKIVEIYDEKTGGTPEKKQNFRKLAETLLLFNTIFNAENTLLQADVKAQAIRRAFQHYIINTDGPIPLWESEDAFDVFRWAAEYAANFNITLAETVNDRGRRETFMTIDDPDNPVRCEEWGRIRGWSSAWSLRQVGHLINLRRFGRFDVIPATLFPFEPAAATHSKTNAMWMADFSQLVYLKQGYVESMLRDLGYAVEWIEDKGTDTQAFVAAKSDYLVLSFRGTREARDFLTDILIRKDVFKVDGLQPQPLGKVHRGFLGAHNSVWDQVLDAINKLGPDLPIFVTGHSLGAALAQLSAIRLAGSGKTVASVYVYGSPRVGNADFRDGYDQVLKKRTFRYINNKDIVTTIPLQLLGFLHVAQPGRQFNEGHQILEIVNEMEIQESSPGADPETDNRLLMADAADAIIESNSHLEIADLTTLSTPGLTYSVDFEGGRIDEHGISQYMFKIACAIVDDRINAMGIAE